MSTPWVVVCHEDVARVFGPFGSMQTAGAWAIANLEPERIKFGVVRLRRPEEAEKP